MQGVIKNKEDLLHDDKTFFLFRDEKSTDTFPFIDHHLQRWFNNHFICVLNFALHLWQYRLWSFKFRDTETNRLIHKNEVFQRMILYVLKWSDDKHTKYMANFYKINFLKHGLYEKVSILKIVHTFIEKFSLAHVAYWNIMKSIYYI
jgi:hypothetical protein